MTKQQILNKIDKHLDAVNELIDKLGGLHLANVEVENLRDYIQDEAKHIKLVKASEAPKQPTLGKNCYTSDPNHPKFRESLNAFINAFPH